MKKIAFIALIILNYQFSIFNSVHAQADRTMLREGNRSYNNKKYDKSEVQYRRALEQDSLDYRGQFNLGNSLYRQKKYDEAARHFDRAMQCPAVSDRQRSRALHNKGNSHLKAGMEAEEGGMQQFQQAVQDYQDALKLDPKNEDTRYNLAYARRLLKQAQQQQQQNQQGQGDSKDQQKQQKQQNQQGQQNQQNQNQQNQQNKDQQGQQGQQGKNQQGNEKDRKDNQGKKRPNKMEQRKQDAERMLEAVKNNERQTLKDQAKKVQAVAGHHSDKDW